MVEPPSNVHAPPRRLAHAWPADPPAKPVNRQPTGRKVRARARAIREVVVVDVGGRLGDVVEDLDRAIQLALADGPRGVVCDCRTCSRVPTPRWSRCSRRQGAMSETGQGFRGRSLP
jgi:hypothetical protein